jgi:hypothetical protein
MSDKSDKIEEPNVRFARSAGKHRISKDSSRHVIAHHRVRFEQPPRRGSPASRSIRIVYLGEDMYGRPLEVMAVERHSGELLVIHAMLLREKYRKGYEEVSG